MVMGLEWPLLISVGHDRPVRAVSLCAEHRMTALLALGVSGELLSQRCCGSPGSDWIKHLRHAFQQLRQDLWLAGRGSSSC